MRIWSVATVVALLASALSGPVAVAATPASPPMRAVVTASDIIVADDGGGLAELQTGKAPEKLVEPESALRAAVRDDDTLSYFGSLHSYVPDPDGRSVDAALSLGGGSGTSYDSALVRIAVDRARVDGHVPRDLVTILARIPKTVCDHLDDDVAVLADGSAAYLGCETATGSRLLRASLPFSDPVTDLVDATPALPSSVGSNTFRDFDVSPDGRWVAWTGARLTPCDDTVSGCQALLRANLATGAPATVVTTASADRPIPDLTTSQSVAISPTDPSRIAFVRQGMSRRTFAVSVADAVTGTIDDISVDPAGVLCAAGPSWSPDGTKLAYLKDVATPVSNDPTRVQAVVAARSADGSGQEQQLTSPGPDDLPHLGTRNTFPFVDWRTPRVGDVDLSLTAQLPDVRSPDAPFTVRWTVTNHGLATADAVRLRVAHFETADDLARDDPLTDVDADTGVDGATCGPSSAFPGDDDLACTLDQSLAPGASATVSLTLRAARAGTYTVVADAHPRPGQRDRHLGAATTATELDVRSSAPATDGRVVAFLCHAGVGSYVALDPDGSDRTILRTTGSCSRRPSHAPSGSEQVTAHALWLRGGGGGGYGTSALERVPLDGGSASSALQISNEVTAFFVSPDETHVLLVYPRTSISGARADLVSLADGTTATLSIGAHPLGWLDGGARLLVRDRDEMPLVVGTDGVVVARMDEATARFPELPATYWAWSDDDRTSVQVGGTGPTLDPPDPRQGVWTRHFADALDPSSAPPSGTFTQSRAAKVPAIVSPSGQQAIAVDDDLDAVDAPRLILTSVAGDPGVATDRATVGVGGGAGDSVEVIGWSQEPVVAGGAADLAPLRVPAPVAEPGFATGGQVVATQVLPPVRPGMLPALAAVSDDVSVLLERTLNSDGSLRGFRIDRLATGDVVDLDTAADGTPLPHNHVTWSERGAMSSDGRYVALLSRAADFAEGGPSNGDGHSFLYVVDVATGERTYVPITDEVLRDSDRGFAFRADTDDQVLVLAGSDQLVSIHWADDDLQTRVSSWPDLDGGVDSAVLSSDGTHAARQVSYGFGQAVSHIQSDTVSLDGTLEGRTSTVPARGLVQVVDDGRLFLDGSTVVDPDTGEVIDVVNRVVDSRHPEPYYLQTAGSAQLSPDGRFAWFHVDGVPDGDPRDYCGASGLGFRDVDGHRTTCAGSATPFHSERASLAYPAGVGTDGRAVAQTATYFDAGSARDVTALRQVSVGQTQYLPSRPPGVTGVEEVEYDEASSTYTMRVSVQLPPSEPGDSPDERRPYLHWRIAGSFEDFAHDYPVDANSTTASFVISHAYQTGQVCVSVSREVNGRERFGGCSSALLFSFPAPPPDVCPNIDGRQPTVPPGMVTTGPMHWCVTPPGPVTDVVVTPGDHSATFHWKAPTGPPGSKVLGFYLYIEDEPEGVFLDADHPYYTYRGLPNGERRYWLISVRGEDSSNSPYAGGFFAAGEVHAPAPAARLRLQRAAGGRVKAVWTLPTATSSRPRDHVLLGYRDHLHRLGRGARSFVLPGRIKHGKVTVAVATSGPGGVSHRVVVTRRF